MDMISLQPVESELLSIGAAIAPIGGVCVCAGVGVSACAPGHLVGRERCAVLAGRWGASVAVATL